jgi:hypothetical protein
MNRRRRWLAVANTALQRHSGRYFFMQDNSLEQFAITSNTTCTCFAEFRAISMTSRPPQNAKPRQPCVVVRTAGITQINLRRLEFHLRDARHKGGQ